MSEIIINEKLVKEFLEESGEPFSEGYKENLENVFYKIIIPQLPREKNLSPAMISKAAKTIIKYGKNTGNEIAISTQVTRLGYVKIYLNWLLGEDHKDTRAFSKFLNRLIKTIPDTGTRIVDPDIVAIMIRNSPFNYQFLIWVGLKTAGRRESLTTLNKTDYQFVTLDKAKKWFEEETYIQLLEQFSPDQEITEITREDKWHGKSKQEITVPLDIQETIRFKEYLKMRRETEEAFIGKYQKTKAKKYLKYKEKIVSDPETNEQLFFMDQYGQYLFWSRDGLRMNPRTVSNTINNIAARSKVDFMTHDTRRRRIQELYAVGIREEIIKKISGHSEKSNTIKRYYDPQKITVYSELFRKK